jgi:hypothetical protein
MKLVYEFPVTSKLLMKYLHSHRTIQQFIPGSVNICHPPPSYELLKLIALM